MLTRLVVALGTLVTLAAPVTAQRYSTSEPPRTAGVPQQASSPESFDGDESRDRTPATRDLQRLTLLDAVQNRANLALQLADGHSFHVIHNA